MQNRVLQVLSLFVLCVALISLPVYAEEMSTMTQLPSPLMKSMKIVPLEKTVEVQMIFNQEIEYSDFELTSPPRIMINVKGDIFFDMLSQFDVKDSVLKQVRVFPNRYGLEIMAELHYQGPKHELIWDAPTKTLKLVINKEFFELSSTQLARGVIYHQIKRGLPTGLARVQAIEVELDNHIEGRKILEAIGKTVPSNDVQLKVVHGKETLKGLTKVSDLAERHNAFVGINGGFFSGSGDPLGLLIENGELVSAPLYDRTAWGIDRDGQMRMEPVSLKADIEINGKAYPVSGFNRVRGTEELVLYNHYYGKKTGTNQWGKELVIENDRIIAIRTNDTTIPAKGYVLSGHGKTYMTLFNTLKVGDTVKVNLKLSPDWLGAGIIYGLGGGPRLVKDGQVMITGKAERFQADILNGRAPRTALGITADNHLLMVAIDGRSEDSIGMSLQEMADMMIDLGAQQAMNLDGGKSTTFVLRDQVFNTPSKGEIAVHNALLLFAEPFIK